MSPSAEQSITTLLRMNWRPPLPSMITPLAVSPSMTGWETNASKTRCTPASLHIRASSIFIGSGSAGEAMRAWPRLSWAT